jgi:transmembrane sensor
MKRFAWVATVAVVALVSIFSVWKWRGEGITTARAERREVVLDDGTLVQVDPQTSLRVRFDESTRRVVLTRGRAVFHVARNAEWPFIVEANDTTIRAVGTAFGVERRGGDVVVVTVAEGKVAVTGAGAAPARAVTAAGQKDSNAASAREPVYLTADQQITVRKVQAPAPVRDVSSARELAWAEGRLVFRNDPVAKVIAEFNRYNPVQLSVSDAALAARPISGVFDATKPEAFIAFLQSAASVHVEREGTRSIVISPADSHQSE